MQKLAAGADAIMMGSILLEHMKVLEKNLRLRVNFSKDIEAWALLEQCHQVQQTDIFKKT